MLGQPSSGQKFGRSRQGPGNFITRGYRKWQQAQTSKHQMDINFNLPKDAIGRFAVVKLWPEIKTAEDECIARLKTAAQRLGIECVEVNADGSLLAEPHHIVGKGDVDFVIHLHYDTPKRYDAFSFVALWNPTQFYHEWGYARCSRNLTTHDDFISCSATAADDHVSRMVRGKHTHLPAKFHLYHSTPDIVHGPSLGDGKLFYAGINWEAISGGKSRHQEVLKRLDPTGLLRIYGPTIFSGVRVWAGYKSYVREVPFDGVSMLDEISKAGIALVLSSQAHKDSALMSNRLFESVAAGALVICDENPFGRRFFGDSLLYIDSRSSVEQIHTDIVRHLDWARQHPDLALAKITSAQAIFREHFSLTQNLADIYSGLADRKQQLRGRQNPPSAPRMHVKLNLLMPEFSDAVLKAHLQSAATQEYADFSTALVIDKRTDESTRSQIVAATATSATPIDIVEVDFYRYGLHSDITTRRKLGEIIGELLTAASASDAFVVVAPNERIYSNHLAVLAGSLQRDAAVHCASTAAILLDGETPVHTVHEVLDFGHVNSHGPCGYGRFIFRMSAVAADIGIALPYLDGRPMAALVGGHTIAQQLPASISIDLQHEYPSRTWDDAAESAVIQDFDARAFTVALGVGILPRPGQALAEPAASMSLSQHIRLRLFNRRWIKAQIHAIRKHGLSARVRVLKQRLGWKT